MSLARFILGLAALAASGACSTLGGDIATQLNTPGLAGARWGMLVTTMDGREIVSIRPDERFVPASNTKMFTIAAAFEQLKNLDVPDPSAGASIRLEPHEGGGPPDLVIVGGGDAALIDADDCENDCLHTLADMVVENGVTHVQDVIGDDRLFPDQRWAPGWGVDDIQVRAGEPVSALVINSNELTLHISPGPAAGTPALATWRQGDDFFRIENDATTVEGDKESVRIERRPGADTVRVYGTIGVNVKPLTIPIAVEDPALTGAWRIKQLLEQRGVKVDGQIRARHRPMATSDLPDVRTEAPPPLDWAGVEIARLTPPPLIDDIRFTSKQSQNLHAEVLLRRLGRINGAGSIEDGLAVVKAMLVEANANPATYDFLDGSGLSIYNRTTPRMVVAFLRWAAKQNWGAAWRDVMPVGGVDGTLARRFKGTALEGKVFAKTGTLNGVNSLSGFLVAKSGQTLVFSVFANDRPASSESAIGPMDTALLSIAAAN
ncbi:MAG TPA: D-alanyl-D-alanine carboxypeptidase/D-alanyl-D-alanine-endopeptidase [Hyphomonadaceae bacterium]|nr:D-alanyl-D-alanine carboxypeptidase/D-alanyl-D-alanine-endopeptidase [Hyphomonadaceae bacterium]